MKIWKLINSTILELKYFEIQTLGICLLKIQALLDLGILKSRFIKISTTLGKLVFRISNTYSSKFICSICRSINVKMFGRRKQKASVINQLRVTII
ncbi:hypothetical protein K0M31_007010 [Melipona bicolor]|uniref:Uncharacterized protein n=1 Tax=Melipona bicolor TaxID=60889 RepID=A0AA40FS39_9HYME|nr:hypothetical protein K0M31_007010 [Melipona bicolor]